MLMPEANVLIVNVSDGPGDSDDTWIAAYKVLYEVIGTICIILYLQGTHIEFIANCWLFRRNTVFLVNSALFGILSCYCCARLCLLVCLAYSLREC